MIFGGGDYSMRIWLDPNKVAARGMTAGDVVRAVREQNVQVSAGTIGGPPQPGASDLTLSINAQGRLVTEEEFANIIIKTGANGEVTRLRDVARIELGAVGIRIALIARQSAGRRNRHLPGARLQRHRLVGQRPRQDARAGSLFPQRV